MDVIYLDHCATTPPAPEVVEAVTETLRAGWANPSSIHRAGQEARRRLELARAEICALLGCRESELVFTSGGTEAADLAIRGALGASPGGVLVTSRLEHASVRELAARLEDAGTEVVWLPNDGRGLVDLESLEKLLEKRGGEVGLVSIAWVNNETGVIQPMAEIAALCAAARVPLHSDGTQRVGKLATDVSSLPVDLLGVAAHKFGGPMGVGALYVRKGFRLAPLLVGGPHERGRRAGTENLPGIVGFGVAARLARQWLDAGGPEERAPVRDRLERGLLERCAGASVNGAGAPRSWDVTNIAFEGLEAEGLLLGLSERGVCASAGAACSSGSTEPSPVLLAMGLPPERVAGSLRFSIGRWTTEREIDTAIETVAAVVGRMHA
ncbi:MAG: cysteine desulfurase family protein [Planctomycetota bacterium]|jgi:cysteine desulfurase